jgi:hypothetical protein
MNNKLNKKIEAGLVIALMFFVTVGSVTIVAEQSNPHSFTIIWQKTFDYKEIDFGVSVDICSDEGFIFGGYTMDYPGDYNMSFVKTDEYGEAEDGWPKEIGIPIRQERANCIQQISDGGYALLGYKTSSQGTEIYLVETDENGNLESEYSYPGNGQATAHDFQQTADGAYIIAGHRQIWGAGCDIWVIKTNPDGSIKWDYTYGGEQFVHDTAYSVQKTLDGGFIIVGEINYNREHWRVVLIKLDSEGNEVWVRTFGEDYRVNAGKSVKQTPDGGYIICGQTGTLYPTQTPNVWLIKTDSDGWEQWSKTFELGYSDSVDLCSYGGYIVTGEIGDIDYSEVYLLKTDEDGNVEAEGYFLNDYYNWGKCVKEISPGRYIIAATSGHPVGFPDYHWQDDMWLLKVKLVSEPPGPILIEGPTETTTNQLNSFHFSSSDPEGDRILYYIDWGDGENTGWIGPYESGESMNQKHMWHEPGEYWVSVRNKDIYDEGIEVWAAHLIKVKAKGCPDGTQITMAMGSTKSIETVRVGDFVQSYDPVNQVLTTVEVINVYEYSGIPAFDRFIFNNNLEVTMKHTIYINQMEWMEANDTRIGDFMLENIPGSPFTTMVPIITKEHPFGSYLTVYDLEIQPLQGEASGYWANGILVGGY